MGKRRLFVETHSSRTRRVIDLPIGQVFVEVDSSTTITVAVEEEDELFEPFEFEEEPLAPSLKRVGTRAGRSLKGG